MPELYKILPVVRIIKNITILDKNIPVFTSVFMLSSILLFTMIVFFRCTISSASMVACQKKRYGEIVVPSNATIIEKKSLLNWIVGIRVCVKIIFQFCLTIKGTMVYSNNEIQSHFKIMAI